MNSLRATVISASALMLGLALPVGVSAQSTWNVYSAATGGCTQNGTNTGSYNNSWGCSSVTGGTAGTAMTASAWSTDRGTNVWVRPDNPATTGTNEYSRIAQVASPGAGYVAQVLSLGSSASAFASAYMSAQGNSGFGAASRTEGLGASSPNHAFDSVAPGTADMMLLDFGSTSVILDKFGIGWTGGDSDITVMRWTGASAPARSTGTTSIGGNQNLTDSLYNAATPTIAGWQLVGSYANLMADAVSPFGTYARSTGATLASSWWLISTFNTTLNGGTACKDANGNAVAGGCTSGDDSFKLNYVVTKLAPGGGGTPTSVPEPTSLALAGVALAGILGARRRVAKRA